MRISLVNKYWYILGGAERVLFATKELLEKHGYSVLNAGISWHRSSGIRRGF